MLLDQHLQLRILRLPLKHLKLPTIRSGKAKGYLKHCRNWKPFLGWLRFKISSIANMAWCKKWGRVGNCHFKNNPLLRITLLECVTTNFRFENRTNSAVPVLNSVTQSPSEKALILDTYKKHVFQGLIHKFSTWFCSSGTVLTCIFMYEKCFQSMYFQS